MSEQTDRPWYYWLGVNLWRKVSEGTSTWVRAHKVWSVLILIVLVCVLFVNRPLLHPAAITIRKYFVLVLLLLAIGYLFYRRIKTAERWGRVVIIAVFLALVSLSLAFGKPVFQYIGMYMHYHLIDRQAIERLPLTNYERIQSFESIGTLVNQEGLSETEDATTPRLVRNPKGDYRFTMSVGPSSEYTLQQLSKDQYEIIATPALQAAPDFSSKYRSEVTFNIGELLPFSRNHENNSVRSMDLLQFFSFEPAEVSFIERADGEWVEVISMIEWKGWLIPRPIFGGVLIIEPGEKPLDYLQRVLVGKGQFIPADEIPQHDYLVGQDLVPIEVSHYMADCFRFKAGFLAPMPGYHESDIRIPTLPDDQIQQPFVIHFDGLHEQGQLYHYYGLEPFQEEKRGLNMSVIIPADGSGGVYYIDHADRKDAYIGSSAIGFKVKESRKNYDWTLNLPAETRPFVREVNGEHRLFWLSTIVTVTKAGENKQTFGGSIPDVTITDARTGNVVWLNKEVVPRQDQWIKQITDGMEGFID